MALGPVKCNKCDKLANPVEMFFFGIAGDQFKPVEYRKWKCSDCIKKEEEIVEEHTKQVEKATSWQEEMEYLDAREYAQEQSRLDSQES